ncbi:hypothetical protein BC830DRAFT_1128949 [Chytriomyces sp. MP71]|nr:hypothetical protein BC830DRAFT_1128949 [Chytriomyces sp. MP71]
MMDNHSPLFPSQAGTANIKRDSDGWVNGTCVWNRTAHRKLSQGDCTYLNYLEGVLTLLYSPMFVNVVDGLLLSLNALLIVIFCTLKEERKTYSSRFIKFNTTSLILLFMLISSSVWMVLQIADKVVATFSTDWIVLQCFLLSYVSFAWVRFQTVIKSQIHPLASIWFYLAILTFIGQICLSAASCWPNALISNQVFAATDAIGFIAIFVVDVAGVYAFRKQLRCKLEASSVQNEAAEVGDRKLAIISKYGLTSVYLQLVLTTIIVLEDVSLVYSSFVSPPTMLTFQLKVMKKCAWALEHFVLFAIPIPLLIMKYKLVKLESKFRSQISGRPAGRSTRRSQSTSERGTGSKIFS